MDSRSEGRDKAQAHHFTYFEKDYLAVYTLLRTLSRRNERQGSYGQEHGLWS